MKTEKLAEEVKIQYTHNEARISPRARILAEKTGVNYKNLLGDKKFIDASSTHTTDEINVRSRIELAIKSFANVD